MHPLLLDPHEQDPTHDVARLRSESFPIRISARLTPSYDLLGINSAVFRHGRLCILKQAARIHPS